MLVRRVGAGVAVLVAALMLAVWSVHALPASGPAASEAAAASPTDTRPNIVMVLMDDASYELLATMPQAIRMQAEGATYENTHVVDSLCCPSRASIFTGRAPHQTKVLTNTPNDPRDPIGGYAAYTAHGNAPRAFNVALQKSGYTTGFIGKYLNGYARTSRQGVEYPPPDVPGWDTLDVILGRGYHGWGFSSTRRDDSGELTLVSHPKPPRSAPVDRIDRHYATNVAADDAVKFLNQHRSAAKPFFLEVATYAPHAGMKKAYPDDPPFPPAFADRAPKGDPTGGFCGTGPCGELSLGDLKGYDDPRPDNRPTFLHGDGTTSPAPPWNTNAVTLTAKRALASYRNRARMVQAIDRMIGRVRAAVGPDTYVVLTSDNGYHLGQLRLNGGKGTPYDFDTHVPLVIVGPGVVPGPRHQFLSSMDLAPTFEKLAGLKPRSSLSGTSFARSLHHPKSPGARYVFYDHTFAHSQPGEVDNDTATGGDLEQIPSYIGVRGKRGLLVRFDLDNSWRGTNYAWELYRYDVPWEDRNVFAEDHSKPWARELMQRLRMWDECAPAQCRAATR